MGHHLLQGFCPEGNLALSKCMYTARITSSRGFRCPGIDPRVESLTCVFSKGILYATTPRKLLPYHMSFELATPERSGPEIVNSDIPPDYDIFGPTSYPARVFGYCSDLPHHSIKFDTPDGKFHKGELGVVAQLNPLNSEVLVVREEDSTIHRYPVRLVLTPVKDLPREELVDLEACYLIDRGFLARDAVKAAETFLDGFEFHFVSSDDY